MADMYSREKRSQIMASIRSKNSKAEVLVFRYLRSNKIYFQRHYKRALGSPDIALPRKKKAVFIDGDFWHGRELERVREEYGVDSFWYKKIAANVVRDEKQRIELAKHGWDVLVVWESDILRKRSREAALNEIREFLTGSPHNRGLTDESLGSIL